MEVFYLAIVSQYRWSFTDKFYFYCNAFIIFGSNFFSISLLLREFPALKINTFLLNNNLYFLNRTFFGHQYVKIPKKRKNMFNKTINTTQSSQTTGLESIIKKSILIACLSVSTLSAGMFDSITAQVVSAVANDNKSSNTIKTSTSSAKNVTVMKAGTPDDSLTSMTECTDLEISNVILGYDGTYTFKNGFKTEKRTGLIKREKGKVTKGCILPSLEAKQSVYLEVDEKKFKALGDSNKWSMQCIKSANPDAGVIPNEVPREGFLSGKEMMLHCGNSEGEKVCAKGSNSSRSGAWKKKLQKDGKKMFSLKAISASLAPKGGEKAYCQYYNSDSGKSLFAVEYIRAN